MAKITFNTALLINGTLDIEIDCYSLLASAKSGEITDIGRMKFKNEIPTNDENASTVRVQQGEIELQAVDKLDDGTSLYDTLEGVFLPSNIYDNLDVKVTFDNGTSYDSGFYLKWENVSFDTKSGLCKLVFTPRVDFNKSTTTAGSFYQGTGTISATASSTITSSASDFVVGDVGKFIIYQESTDIIRTLRISSYISATQVTVSDTVSLVAKPFNIASSVMNSDASYPFVIGGVNDMRYLDNATTSIYVDTAYKLVKRFLSMIYNTSNVLINGAVRGASAVKIMREDAADTELDLFFTDQGYRAIDYISRLASLEGSVFGSVFGKSYYSYRLDNGISDVANFRHEMLYDNCIDIQKIRSKTVLNSVSVTIKQDSGLTQSPLLGAGRVASQTLNPIAVPTFDVAFAPPIFWTQTYSSGTGTVTPSTGAQEFQLQDNLIDKGVDSYSKSQGGDGSVRYKIEYYGLAEIMPYHRVYFDASTPSTYRLDGASTRLFAISSIEYDFMMNKTLLEIYQIDTI